MIFKGIIALFFCGDISGKAILKSFAREVVETYGKIDYLINL
ncbi:hypothetical protein [Clostridium magnum]|nr:hypothetical protein [Clostridium magnum]